MFARELEKGAQQDLDYVGGVIEGMNARLGAEMADMEGVREVMGLLADLRAKESDIEVMVPAIEDSYFFLRRFKVPLPPETEDAVDQLAFQWSKLKRRLKRELDDCGGAKGHQAPCRTPPATPRTFPDSRARTSMGLARREVAAPTPSMRTAEGGASIIIIICAHPSRTPRLQSHDWESGHSRIRK